MTVINSSLLMVLLILLGLGLVAVFIVWRRQISSGAARHAMRPSEPANVMDYQGHLQAADKLYQAYRYEDALLHYMQALRFNNRDVMIYYRVGRIYKQMEDYNQAEIAFRNILTIAPESIEALMELSRLYVKQNKMNQALRYLNKLLQHKPDQEEAMRLKIKVLLELNNPRAAKELIDVLLKKDPENPELLMMMGKTAQKSENFEDALKTYQSLLKQDPTDRNNLKFQIYQVYQRQALHDQAIETLEDILKTGTGTIGQEELMQALSDSWCAKGAEAARLNNKEEALQFYQKALECYQGNADVYVGLGRLYADWNQTDTALTYFQQALDVGVENTQTCVELAMLYERLDRFDDAILCLRKAEALLPTAQVYYYLGTLYGLKGDMQNCATYLNKTLGMDHNHLDAMYNLAVAYEEQRKLKEALNLYKRILELHPTHAEAKANMKALQARLNKW